MKQNTLILLLVLAVVAAALFFGGSRYGMFGMHGYFNDPGPGHMWSGDDFAPRHVRDDAFMGQWHEAYEETAADFRSEIEATVVAEIGQPIEGFEPFMFMQVYPGLEPQDFDGVEALIGHYEYRDGELVHELDETEMIHSAAAALSEVGYAQLLFSVAVRRDMHPMDVELDAVIAALGEGGDGPVDAPDDDAGPPPAPVPAPGDGEVTVCTDEMKQAEFCTMEYAPVCGLVEVQCITEPCDPVPETFSNGCVACSQGNVISYTPGACEQ